MNIKLELTPAEAHNTLVFIDLALKSDHGGIKVMREALAITDKINSAVELAKQSGDTAANETRPGTHL